MTTTKNSRTGKSLESLKSAIAENLFYTQGKFPEIATKNDNYLAVANTVREHLLQRWIDSTQNYMQSDVRVVCYFSAEFLLGPHLRNNLINLGLLEQMKKATASYGIDLEELIEQEEEPGLGNGGLGRLAACYMDSLSTLKIPAIGYGVRYEFGIFDQEIQNGWQVEKSDTWLKLGNPWEIHRPERTYIVKYGGKTESYVDEKGAYRVHWIPNQVVKGVAYDTPILGYKVDSANLLRLWSAQAVDSFNFQDFNSGDYMGAVRQKMDSENITKILYPNDDTDQGKRLRLQQQYFFVSCSLQDMIAIELQKKGSLDDFHKRYASQMNDTHPSIAVAELMRLLMDENKMDWDKAWNITHRVFSYTNHTLLPEALETWSLPLFKSILPRHLEIIYEINERFINEVKAKFPDDNARLSRMSLIGEAGEKTVRMANLACVGSHAINGVAALHTQLLKENLLHDFYELTPEKFTNKTNGVTPRRWMVVANPRLSALISEKIGDAWITDLRELKKLEKFVDDKEFISSWQDVKLQNKKEQAEYTFEHTGVKVNPESLFDVQVKRMHEYKRQLLNVLHIITLYNRIKENPDADVVNRTFVFGGKAAPGYFMAKLIVKLITSVGDVVNNDIDVAGRLKVVFVPNFNVKLGHRIYPMADLSEQISTAGLEASGTGNMKFSMNGALTIGTLDGANVEIREEVGEENFFLFGMSVEEVAKVKSSGYNPKEYYEKNDALRSVLNMIIEGNFSDGDVNLFKPLMDELLYEDKYMLLADYQSFIETQDRVDETWKNRLLWTKMSILNVARIGKFSSDRAINEYAKEIWNVKPVNKTKSRKKS